MMSPPLDPRLLRRASVFHLAHDHSSGLSELQLPGHLRGNFLDAHAEFNLGLLLTGSGSLLFQLANFQLQFQRLSLPQHLDFHILPDWGGGHYPG